ncbi:MAG TPA: PAS domain S-box protein [Bacteroidota bacterium]|nr:PAS domain S-box protein [Bacteroidota bacterium]
MHVAGLDILLVIMGGTLLLLIFAVGYIMVSVGSHQRVLAAQRARLEEVVRSEEKYHSLFDNSLAGIIRFSPETWDIYDSNEAVQFIWGCSSQSELQSCIYRIPETVRLNINAALKAEKSISGVEIRTTRPNGEDLWVLLSAKLTKEQGLAQAVIIDITERELFEEKNREQSALLDQTRDAIMVIDESGELTFWNAGAELTYGWQKEFVLGKKIRELLYAAANVEHYQEAMEDIEMFGEWNGEQFHTRSDGKEILVESHWRRIERGVNRRNFILVVNLDITDKKRLEAQFLRARKMESIALLAGGMAHDLQNILAPISISIPLLRKKLSDESSLAILQVVEESAHSGLDLVKNIMTYGRGIAGERVVLDVGYVLDQVLTLVRQSTPSSIVIEKRSNGRAALVAGDMNQLKQVFLNLCVNARDAMPAGGRLLLEVHHCDADEHLLEYHPDAAPGSYVVIHVSDSGKGIADENLDRIFEPFFTTREQGEGTGLGLSIAHGIVQSHDGYITVKSVVGKGTSFRVYLPAIEMPDAASVKSEPA